MGDPAVLEQIAMYMVALPCPPLPVLVNVEKYNGFDEEEMKHINGQNEIVCSSHDLLAGLIICAMHRNNAKLNDIRKQIQIDITKEFIDALTNTDDMQSMYSACQKFTADYVQSFEDPDTHASQIRFVGMDDVCNGDKVHQACCSWNVAQDIIHAKKRKSDSGDDKGCVVRDKAFFERMSYKELIQEHCARLVLDNKHASSRIDVIVDAQ
jgi:hypothetical protein